MHLCNEAGMTAGVYYCFLEIPEGKEEEVLNYWDKFWPHAGVPVAYGIVAEWIHQQPHVLTETLFEQYSERHRQWYILKNRSNPDSTKESMQTGSYLDCISQERKKIKLSYRVFEYVNEDEQRKLRSLISNYLKFLYQKAERMDIYKNAELRVLRHLQEDAEELMPEGMEDWEFYATCERLEEQGCVRVAWIEGHEAEDAMILDAGRMLLKELEIELKGEESELERLKRENEELKAKLQEMQNPSDEEIVKDLAACFYGNTDDARDFLTQIRLVTDKEKPAIAKQYMNQNKLSQLSSKTDLHTIMVKHGLYSKQLNNWIQLLNKA